MAVKQENEEEVNEKRKDKSELSDQLELDDVGFRILINVYPTRCPLVYYRKIEMRHTDEA